MAQPSTTWKPMPIESLCTRITSGGTPLRSNRKFYEGGSIPWVKTGELHDWFVEDTEEKITPEAIEYSSAKLFPKNTILMAMYGDGRTITSLGILRREGASNQACCALIVNCKVCRPLFLFYSLKEHRRSLLKLAYGGAQRNLNAKTIRNFEVPVPPLAEQERIEAILSAYDGLIENNTRRIKILEQMARMLYREWFVNFRFPGHKSSSFTTSALGEIPEGWQVSTLGEVTTKIGSGATPRGGKEAYQKEGIALIRSLNIYDYSFEMANLAFINHEQARQLDNVTIQPNDVLLNITGASVCRCAIVPSSLLPARVNQHVAIVRANPASIDPFFLLDSINNDHNKQRLLGIAQGGATREALTKDSIAGFPILVPPLDLVRRYGQIASAFHTQREKLSQRITNLRTTRDLLLPKLVSGEIELPEVESALQGATA